VNLILPGRGGSEDYSWPQWNEEPDMYSNFVQDVKWLIKAIGLSRSITTVIVELPLDVELKGIISNGIKERFKMILQPLELFSNVELEIRSSMFVMRILSKFRNLISLTSSMISAGSPDHFIGSRHCIRFGRLTRGWDGESKGPSSMSFRYFMVT
jgi:hypothetical protein